MFFQLEQAWWFYEDWICDKRPEMNLPRFNNFKPFARELFLFSEILPEESKFNSMWTEFATYKRGISNYGCILLSDDYTQIILCRGKFIIQCCRTVLSIVSAMQAIGVFANCLQLTNSYYFDIVVFEYSLEWQVSDLSCR